MQNHVVAISKANWNSVKSLVKYMWFVTAVVIVNKNVINFIDGGGSCVFSNKVLWSLLGVKDIVHFRTQGVAHCCCGYFVHELRQVCWQCESS